jgi:hypothetical protein
MGDRAMRVVMLGVLTALALAGCTPEGAVNKAKQTRSEELLQEQQREQERNRIIQDSQQQRLPSTTR